MRAKGHSEELELMILNRRDAGAGQRSGNTPLAARKFPQNIVGATVFCLKALFLLLSL